MAQPTIPAYLEASFDEDFIYKDELNGDYSFYSFEIGNLNIRQGRIIACDPFLYNNNLPFTAAFPTGLFPVQLAVARINDDERVGFARVKFSGAAPVTWALAVCEGQDILMLNEGEIYGYVVDAGTGAFMDTSAAGELMNFLTAEQDNYEILTDEMEKNYKHTWDWLLWERNGANVAMFKSGWGDGVYATYIGYDNAGAICRLVTDFAVID